MSNALKTQMKRRKGYVIEMCGPLYGPLYFEEGNRSHADELEKATVFADHDAAVTYITEDVPRKGWTVKVRRLVEETEPPRYVEVPLHEAEEFTFYYFSPSRDMGFFAGWADLPDAPRYPTAEAAAREMQERFGNWGRDFRLVGVKKQQNTRLYTEPVE